MKNIIVYPGTFDPITYGHIDLVERATRIMDNVIVAVAANPLKKSLFTLEERVNLIKDLFLHNKNVQVFGFRTLLVDFMRLHKAKTILRGLRVVSDFDHEFRLAGMNRHLAPDIDSLFLMPADNYTYLSSSIVREVAALNGDVTQFVPPLVEKALRIKLADHNGA